MEEQSTFSLDDLPAPMNEMPRLGGPGPFVINLATAGAPIALPRDLAAAFPGTQIYQLQRTEDRRTRYRLRLGPFELEDAADAALLKVRELYPCALTATAAGDDLRIVAHLLRAVPVEEVSFDIAELSLLDEVAPLPVPAPNSRAPATATPASATATAPAAPAAGGATIESTQTIRPLTQLELVDEQQEPCYVIQLSVAAQAFDPDELPSLDIFSCYRLYSVANGAQGEASHALRLGFFSSEVAARAVRSYIAAHYPSAQIERVSQAERERFESQRSVEARKDVGATGVHAVIEITGERLVRPRFSSLGDPPTAAASR